jgi:hypothetical protein
MVVGFDADFVVRKRDIQPHIGHMLQRYANAIFLVNVWDRRMLSEAALFQRLRHQQTPVVSLLCVLD